MISFLIPTYNEADQIAAQIAHIRHLMISTKCDFEILVGDHGSTDDTVAIALGELVKVVNCERCYSIGEVRNMLANEAAYLSLVFVDADVLIHDSFSDWIVAHEGRVPFGVVYGSYPESISESWISKAWSRNLKRDYFGTGFMLVNYDTFSNLGQFDAELESGEDFDFCQTARSLGVPLRTDPRLRAFHLREPESLKTFYLREVWHGRGDWFGPLPRTSLAFYSFAFTLLLLLIPVWLLLGFNSFAWSSVIMLCLMMTYLTYHKFGFSTPIRYYPINFLLSAVYMVARTRSLCGNGLRLSS